MLSRGPGPGGGGSASRAGGARRARRTRRAAPRAGRRAGPGSATRTASTRWVSPCSTSPRPSAVSPATMSGWSTPARRTRASRAAARWSKATGSSSSTISPARPVGQQQPRQRHARADVPGSSATASRSESSSPAAIRRSVSEGTRRLRKASMAAGRLEADELGHRLAVAEALHEAGCSSPGTPGRARGSRRCRPSPAAPRPRAARRPPRDGRELAAGAAPRRPEVHHHGDLARALDHVGVEGRLGHVHVSPLHSSPLRSLTVAKAREGPPVELRGGGASSRGHGRAAHGAGLPVRRQVAPRTVHHVAHARLAPVRRQRAVGAVVVAPAALAHMGHTARLGGLGPLASSHGSSFVPSRGNARPRRAVSLSVSHSTIARPDLRGRARAPA